MMDTSSLVWMYCIGTPAAARAALRTPGLEPDAPPTVVDLASESSGAPSRATLAAVVSLVSRADYDEVALGQRMRDLDWVADRGVAHDRIVERCFAAGPTVPLRFGTLFASVARVESLLARDYEHFARLLARLEGKAEWALAVHADARRIEGRAAERARQATSAAPTPMASGPGRAYLEAKRAAAQARSTAHEHLPRWVDEIHARHAGAAVAAVAHPIPEGHTLLHRAAFLVPRDGEAAFLAASEAEARRVAPEGLRLRLTGPWPPYSFASAPLGGVE